MTSPITRLNPPSLPDATASGYSQISIAEPGRLAFVSGQVAETTAGDPPPATLAEQAAIAVANAGAALAAIGATAQDIAMARVYIVDLTPERLGALMPHLLAFFDGANPSLTGIGVAALASEGWQVELEMIVRVPG